MDNERAVPEVDHTLALHVQMHTKDSTMNKHVLARVAEVVVAAAALVAGHAEKAQQQERAQCQAR